jgi:hypothetical protein
LDYKLGFGGTIMETEVVLIEVAGNERKGFYPVAKFRGGSFAYMEDLSREAQIENARNLAIQMGNPSAKIEFLPEAEALLVG